MDLPSLTKLVAETPLLTEPERAYWLEHLPTMKPEQCARLEQILTQTIEIPFANVITNFFESFLGKSA